MDANLKKMLITTGFPQGSVWCGPFLFSIFINDLPLCSKIFEIIMYADDTTLYCDIHGIPNIQHLLNPIRSGLYFRQLTIRGGGGGFKR